MCEGAPKLPGTWKASSAPGGRAASQRGSSSRCRGTQCRTALLTTTSVSGAGVQSTTSTRRASIPRRAGGGDHLRGAVDGLDHGVRPAGGEHGGAGARARSPDRRRGAGRARRCGGAGRGTGGPGGRRRRGRPRVPRGAHASSAHGVQRPRPSVRATSAATCATTAPGPCRRRDAPAAPCRRARAPCAGRTRRRRRAARGGGGCGSSPRPGRARPRARVPGVGEAEAPGRAVGEQHRVRPVVRGELSTSSASTTASAPLRHTARLTRCQPTRRTPAAVSDPRGAATGPTRSRRGGRRRPCGRRRAPARPASSRPRTPRAARRRAGGAAPPGGSRLHRSHRLLAQRIRVLLQRHEVAEQLEVGVGVLDRVRALQP